MCDGRRSSLDEAQLYQPSGRSLRATVIKIDSAESLDMELR
jgi:hypothetical protein